MIEDGEADCFRRPILTPKTVLPLFFAIGIIFAPIGGVLLWASAQVCLNARDFGHSMEEKGCLQMFVDRWMR